MKLREAVKRRAEEGPFLRAKGVYLDRQSGFPVYGPRALAAPRGLGGGSLDPEGSSPRHGGARTYTEIEEQERSEQEAMLLQFFKKDQ